MIGRLGMVGSSLVRGDSVVSKTMFAPGDWRPITQASAKGRATIRRRSLRNRAEMRSNPKGPIEERGNSAKGGQIHPGIRLKHGSLKINSQMGFPGGQTPSAKGGTVMAQSFPDGRGGGAIHYNPHVKLDRMVIRHEEQHIAPRRNPIQTRTRLASSAQRNGAEEGRADFLSRGKQKSGEYPGSPRFRAGYNQTQSKMQADAGRKRRKPITAGSTPTWATLGKADSTMSAAEVKRLTTKHGTVGPLPKTLNRDDRMKAYEARYVAAGGKKAEKWKRRAAGAEVGRNVGVAGATLSAAGILAARGRHTAKVMAKIPKVTSHRLEAAGLASAAGGGGAELYGEYARHRRASYANSPAGVAGSALTRMRAYTPGAKT